jgi:hypothetical protein
MSSWVSWQHNSTILERLQAIDAHTDKSGVVAVSGSRSASRELLPALGPVGRRVTPCLFLGFGALSLAACTRGLLDSRIPGALDS